MARCVEHLKPDDTPVLPVEHDHGVDAVGRLARDAVPSRHQWLISEVDVRGIDLGIVRNSHVGKSSTRLAPRSELPG